jgi:hypothetical protein
VLSSRRVVASWRFPVKLQSSAVRDSEPASASRSFRVVDPAGGARVINVFSDTWLSGIDDATAFVSFEWYPTKSQDGATRILKDIVDVAYGESQWLDVGNGVRIRASYRGRSKERP